jgi:hypothetical protein
MLAPLSGQLPSGRAETFEKLKSFGKTSIPTHEYSLVSMGKLSRARSRCKVGLGSCKAR